MGAAAALRCTFTAASSAAVGGRCMAWDPSSAAGALLRWVARSLRFSRLSLCLPGHEAPAFTTLRCKGLRLPERSIYLGWLSLWALVEH